MSKTGQMFHDKQLARDEVVRELLEGLEFYAMSWRTETKELRGDPKFNGGRDVVLYKSQVFPNHDLMNDCGNKARFLISKYSEPGE